MSALPPDETRSMLDDNYRPTHARQAFEHKWAALHEQAALIATIADLAEERATPEIMAFPTRLDQSSGWQRNLAWQMLEDIEAMMQPGLTALRTITSRGKNAGAPALALWREFYAARGALMAVLAEAPEEHKAKAV